MRKFIGLVILLVATTTILWSCGTTKNIAETQIVHDSVVQYRDRVVYKLAKDSVSEQEKTSIFVKHDTVSNTDTVYVRTEKLVERWKNRVDTIYKTEYLRARSDTMYVREPAVQKKAKMSTRTRAGLIFGAAFVVWLIGFIYIRSKR